MSSSSRFGKLSAVGLETHWKNLIALSLSITIIICSTTAAQSTQSTFYKDNGLGFASLSIVYICCAVSSFFAPIVVRFLGTKWTLVVSEVCYGLYIAANLYPTFYTLIPISVIYGSSAGPLYTAQGTYLTSSAISYSMKSGQDREHVISVFNGVYYMMYFIGVSPGSIMLSLLLRNGQQELEDDIHFNQSLLLTSCGARDNCFEPLHTAGSPGNSSQIDNYRMPDVRTRTTVFVSLVVLAVASILVAVLFVDHLHTFSTHQPIRDDRSSSKRVLDVAFSSKFLLILPLIVLFAYDQALFLGDVTKSFAGCTSGIETIGYVTAIYYSTAGLSAFVIGYLVKITGRTIVLTIAWIGQSVLMIFMVLWNPATAAGWEIYVMSFAYGIGSGTREAQVSSILGILFPHDLEAAFSAQRFYWGTVIGIAFAVGTANLCVAYKIWFGVTWYSIAMVFYYVLEWKISRTARSESDKNLERVKSSDDEDKRDEMDVSKDDIKEGKLYVWETSI